MDIKIEHAASRHKQVLARLGLIESVNALNMCLASDSEKQPYKKA